METKTDLKGKLREALLDFLNEEIDWDGKTALMSLVEPNHSQMLESNEALLKEILKDLRANEAIKGISVKVMTLESDISVAFGNAAEVAYIQGYLEGRSGDNVALANLIHTLFDSQEEVAAQ